MIDLRLKMNCRIILRFLRIYSFHFTILVFFIETSAESPKIVCACTRVMMDWQYIVGLHSVVWHISHRRVYNLPPLPLFIHSVKVSAPSNSGTARRRDDVTSRRRYTSGPVVDAILYKRCRKNVPLDVALPCLGKSQ